MALTLGKYSLGVGDRFAREAEPQLAFTLCDDGWEALDGIACFIVEANNRVVAAVAVCDDGSCGAEIDA